MVKHIPWTRVVDDRPVGPIVNVAFTIDGECVDLLHRAGKNRSRTVRNAIKSYLRGDNNRKQMEEAHAKLMENFQRVCMERNDLQDRLATMQFANKNVLLQDTVEPGQSLISRFLKRCRNLFNKHRK